MPEHPGRRTLRKVIYRKSTYSSGAQECVAVGFGHGLVGVQDMKEGPDARDRTTLVLTASAFTTFLREVRAGQTAALFRRQIEELRE